MFLANSRLLSGLDADKYYNNKVALCDGVEVRLKDLLANFVNLKANLHILAVSNYQKQSVCFGLSCL